MWRRAVNSLRELRPVALARAAEVAVAAQIDEQRFRAVEILVGDRAAATRRPPGGRRPYRGYSASRAFDALRVISAKSRTHVVSRCDRSGDRGESGRVQAPGKSRHSVRFQPARTQSIDGAVGIAIAAACPGGSTAAASAGRPRASRAAPPGTRRRRPRRSAGAPGLR